MTKAQRHAVDLANALMDWAEPSITYLTMGQIERDWGVGFREIQRKHVAIIDAIGTDADSFVEINNRIRAAASLVMSESEVGL